MSCLQFLKDILDGQKHLSDDIMLLQWYYKERK